MIRSQLFEVGDQPITDRTVTRGGFDERAVMPQPARLMRTVSFVLAFCSMLGIATAQTAPQTRSMSLMDCLQEALQYNIDLQIDRYNPQIAEYNLRGAYGGWDPTFNISGEHNFNLAGGGFNPDTGTVVPPRSTDQNAFTSGLNGLAPWGLGYQLFGSISETYGNQIVPFDSTGGSVGINLRQPLLKNFWIDPTRLNIQINKLTLTQTKAGLLRNIMDTSTSVELAYYNLVYARENLKVLEKAVELASQSVRENKKKVEVGTLAPLDEKQAESQEAASRADLLSAQQVLDAAENALKRLLTDNFASVQPIQIIPTDPLTSPTPQFDLQLSWGRALRQRPDLQQAKLDVEKLGVQLKYDRNQLYPQLDLVGTYGHGTGGADIHEFSQGFDEFRMGNKPFYTYGAQLTVPLGNVSVRNRYRANKVTLQQLLLGVKKLEQDIMVQVDDGIKLTKASFERITATREAREYAEAALSAEQKKLENGKSTNFEVLRLQRDLTSASSEEIRAKTEYRRNLAQLSFVEATTLERLSLDVHSK